MKNILSLLLILIGTTVNAKTLKITEIQKQGDLCIVAFKEQNFFDYKKNRITQGNVEIKNAEFKIKHLELGFYECQNTNKKILFEDFTEKDKITIDFTSYGCEHYDREKIVFFYQNGDLVAELYVRKTLKKREKLKLDIIEYLINFEKKVIEIENNKGGCTKIDIYAFIKNGKKEFLVKDDSCDWNGYDKIKRKLFNL